MYYKNEKIYTEPVGGVSRDPFPEEDKKAYSEDAVLQPRDVIASPEQAAEALMSGEVLIGCRRVGGLIVAGPVLVIRRNCLIELRLYGNRDLHLMCFYALPDDSYRDEAKGFFHMHDIVFADRAHVLKLVNSRYPDDPNSKQLYDMLQSSSVFTDE